MRTYDKGRDKNWESSSNKTAKATTDSAALQRFSDNRPAAIIQRKIQQLADNKISRSGIQQHINVPLQLKQEGVIQRNPEDALRVANKLLKDGVIPDVDSLMLYRHNFTDIEWDRIATAYQDNNYNTNVRMGTGGKKSHKKASPGDPTTATIRGKGGKTREVTKRQEKTLDRHIERIRNGEGKVKEVTKDKGDPITVIELASTVPDRPPHIYGVKKPDGKSGESGIHPRTPLDGGDYDSDSDDE